MSYPNRRGVNVSQYLRNLNVQEPAVEETFITDEELAKDLALFTNTQFLDFETGQNTDYQAPPVKPEIGTQTSPVDDMTPTDPLLADFSANIDFMTSEFFFLYFTVYFLCSSNIIIFDNFLHRHESFLQACSFHCYVHRCHTCQCGQQRHQVKVATIEMRVSNGVMALRDATERERASSDDATPSRRNNRSPRQPTKEKHHFSYHSRSRRQTLFTPHSRMLSCPRALEGCLIGEVGTGMHAAAGHECAWGVR